MSNHIRLLFAVLAGVVAIIVITRGMLLAMPRSVPTPTTPTMATSGTANRAEPVRTLSPDELNVDVASEGVQAVVERLREAIAIATTTIDQGRPAEKDAQAIAQNASMYFGTVVGGGQRTIMLSSSMKLEAILEST